MEYRKFKADYLFTGYKLLGDSLVLITDTTGKVIDIVDESQAGKDVQVLNGILSPGFINSHCHIELSHLKNNIPEKKGLINFVFNIVTGRHFEINQIKDSIKSAEAEMLQCGIVAVGDICNNDLSLLQKEKRNLSYYNFIEISGWHPDVAEARFKNSECVLNKFLQKKLRASLVPHAPYSVSKNLWGKITPLFTQKVVSIHNQETRQEDEFFLEGTGQLIEMYKMMKIDNSHYVSPNIRSVQTYFKNFSGAASIILVHNTFTTQADLDYIKENTNSNQLISFCLCPNANLYIENTLPPAELLLQNNCNVVIGTDSLASNRQLNVLEELKTLSKNFPHISTEILFQWATINGAKALQMDNQLGSFDKGKTPGIVLIENVVDKKITKDSSAKRIL